MVFHFAALYDERISFSGDENSMTEFRTHFKAFQVRQKQPLCEYRSAAYIEVCEHRNAGQRLFMATREVLK